MKIHFIMRSSIKTYFPAKYFLNLSLLLVTVPQWQLDQYGLCSVLPQSPVDVDTKTEVIELVPMGAARLRISSFPVVK